LRLYKTKIKLRAITMQKNLIIMILIFFLTAVAIFAGDDEMAKKDRIKYIGDLVITEEDIVEGDAIVMQGDLIIKGTVKGDAIISLGDAFIDSGGYVMGDIVTWKGKIYVDDFGKVDGKSIEHRLFDMTMDEDIFSVGTNDKRSNKEYDWEINIDKDEFDFDEEYDSGFEPRLSYNKVDGFFLGAKLPVFWSGDISPGLKIDGYGGYGFSNDRWQYFVELEKKFFRKNRLTFGIESHKITDTDDEWIIENWENSLAAFFLHEDFRDYFYRTGYSAYIGQNFGRVFSLRVKYLNDEYDATENNTNWALFGGDKDFRPNYGFLGYGVNAEEGNMRSVIAEGTLDILRGNLLLTGSVERSGYGLGGDFEFTRYIFEAKFRTRLSSYEGLAFRLKLGASGDDYLPVQKIFTLGGISTLRGYYHKEFAGDQMALLNVEYHIFAKKHADYFWLLKHMQLGIFADIGSTDNMLFSEFDIDQYKSDVGFAIMSSDGDLRLNIARRTDTGKDPWVVTFRVTQPF